MKPSIHSRQPSAPPCARFAIVLHPGTLFEAIDAYTTTLNDALAWAADYRETEIDVDVMRVNADGSLTTEF